jgi:hypothetical protein
MNVEKYLMKDQISVRVENSNSKGQRLSKFQTYKTRRDGTIDTQSNLHNFILGFKGTRASMFGLEILCHMNAFLLPLFHILQGKYCRLISCSNQFNMMDF